jgi:hypothetical protein
MSAFHQRVVPTRDVSVSLSGRSAKKILFIQQNSKKYYELDSEMNHKVDGTKDR